MHLAIGTKIQAITATALLGLAALVGLAAYGLHDAVTHARALKTRDLVETAHGVLAYFEAQERAGRLGREAAQQAAIAAVGSLHYDGKEYFWINDLQPRMVVHPKAELIGKDLSEIRDPTGKRLFMAMLDVVRTDGAGFVPYLWPKPGAEQPAEKISYVKGFQPWGWVIGSGVYADDTLAQVRGTLIQLLAGMGLAVALVGALALSIGRSVSRPALALADVMGALAAGDLTRAVPATRRRDEIGRMIEAVRVFKDSLIRARALEQEAAEARAGAEAQRRSAMQQIADRFEAAVGGIVGSVTAAATDLQVTARSMSGTASETAAQSAGVAAAAEEAAANVSTVAAAAEELGSSVQEIGRQVNGSAQLAQAAVDEAAQAAGLVRELSGAVSKVGDVVTLIAGIAGQTNLLALNATIEAARAGESGRGFAVVAAEVKELATQTARATEEISGQIARIQGSTGLAVSAIGSIAARIREISDVATAIAAAVEEQEAATQEIVRNVAQAAAGTGEVTGNIGGVAAAVEQTGAAAHQVLASASDLSRQSEQLSAEVVRLLANVRAA